MQQHVTPRTPLRASTISNAAQALLSIESTIVERIALLEIMTRVVDDMCERNDLSPESRALNGLSFMLRDTGGALETAFAALDIARREMGALHAR